jgi:hypothetical protein
MQQSRAARETDGKKLTGRRGYGTFRKSVVQFVSQVFPPSGENACSQWADVAVIFDQMNRTLTGFPRNVSSA